MEQYVIKGGNPLVGEVEISSVRFCSPAFQWLLLLFFQCFQKNLQTCFQIFPLFIYQYLRTFRTMEFFLHTDP